MVASSEKTTPVHIISDHPVSEHPGLGFDAYADVLAELIANKDNATPLVMGIHGSWGSGKTTLMNAIKARLDEDRLDDAASFRRCKTVWFQAWKHNREAALLAALVESIFKAMSAQGFFTLAKSKVGAIARRFDRSKIFSAISRLVSGMDVSEFFSELPDKERLGMYDTFQKFLDDLLWTFLNWRFNFSEQEKPDDKKGAMVIFIDDLDRCAPGTIVDLLEVIQLFMNRSGYIFVLAADEAVLLNALAQQYDADEAVRFLEKALHTRFRLPAISAESLVDLLDVPAGLGEHLPLLMPALGYNPRRFKRFINHFNLLNRLVQSRKMNISTDSVAAWTILRCVFDDWANEIRKEPEKLFTFQKYLRNLQNPESSVPLWQIPDAQLSAREIPEAFHPYIRRRGLAELVLQFKIKPQAFDQLLALNEVV